MRSHGCFSSCCSLAAAHAESWKTAKQACKDAQFPQLFSGGVQWHNAEECVVDFFTLDPIGPVVGSVTTGSAFGGGFRFVSSPRKTTSSPSKVYIPTMDHFCSAANINSPSVLLMTSKTGGRPGGRRIPPKETCSSLPFTSIFIPRDFYGIGPNSTLAGQAVYQQHETWLGTRATHRLCTPGSTSVFSAFPVNLNSSAPRQQESTADPSHRFKHYMAKWELHPLPSTPIS